MLDFKKIELSDKVWTDSLLRLSDYRATEFCFTSMFIWSDVFRSEIARSGDFVVVRSMVDDSISYIESHDAGMALKGNGDKPKVYYILPAGNGDIREVVSLLMADAEALGREFRLTAIPPSLVPVLEEAFPGRMEFHEARDTFDYIYDAELFRNLPGTKYQARRNQISIFKRSQVWSYESICAGSEDCRRQLEECVEMTEEWCRIKDCSRDISMWHERSAVLKALENFNELGLRGGIIRVYDDISPEEFRERFSPLNDKSGLEVPRDAVRDRNGRVVAYTIGEPVNSDTFIIHIEKAFTEFRGAYPAIAHEFLAHEAACFKYVNREDDAGNEGLRKAKMSYHPVFFEEKWYACLK